MTLILIGVLLFVCLALYKPGVKFFIIWLAINTVIGCFLHPAVGLWGFLMYFFVCGSDGEYGGCSDYNYSDNTNMESAKWYDKVYEDGTHRVKNISNTGFYYSDGKDSLVGMFGEEHRSNGEVVQKNAYLSGRRDIYNSEGEYIGFEYEDSLGITHRVDKSR